MKTRKIKKVLTPEILKHLGEDNLTILKDIKCEGKKG